MKQIKILAFSALAGLALTACIKSGDLNLDPVPDIGFTYTSKGFTLTFNSSVEGVSDIAWKTSDGGSGTGATLTHTFPKTDTYWVEMRGTYKGVSQNVSAKVRVAKEAKVKMDDKSISDWENVNDPDFVFKSKDPGKLPIVIGKFDYDVNYIYLYLEFDTTVSPNCDAANAVSGILLDIDADLNTGFLYQDKIGSEYFVVGKLTSEKRWFQVQTGEAGDDWFGDAVPELKAGLVFGHQQQDGNIYKAEFALDRNLYRLTSTKMMLYFLLMDSGWGGVDNFKSGDTEYITLSMDKME